VAHFNCEYDTKHLADNKRAEFYKKKNYLCHHQFVFLTSALLVEGETATTSHRSLSPKY